MYEGVEKFTFWHGPVWNIKYGGSAGTILQGRVSDAKVLVEANTADLKILSIDAVEYQDDRVFMLAQTSKTSVILVMDDQPKVGEKPSVINLGKIC